MNIKDCFLNCLLNFLTSIVARLKEFIKNINYVDTSRLSNVTGVIILYHE